LPQRIIVKVLILSEGTRGDIEPCFALAEAVDAAGHQSVVVGWNWSPAAGLQDAGPGVSYAAVGQREIPDAVRAVAAKVTHGGAGGLLARAELARRLRPLLARTLDEVWAVASAGADLVVHQPGIMAGQHIAEKLRVPSIAMSLTPIYVPTRDFANPLLSRSLPVPKIWNPATYALTQLFAAPYWRAISAWRRQTLKLEPRTGQHKPLRWPDGRPGPVLGAYSRHVVPPLSDAPPGLYITGYWLRAAAETWEPPGDLAEFLARGAPPVYAGFSSTHMDRSNHGWQTLLSAIQMAGVRAVVAAGSASCLAGKTGDGIHVISGAPHSWLFPRVAAIVHHGGAGSTAAAIRSGRPQIVCPFSFDQPFWAARMHRLGIAGSVQPLRSHSPQTLAAAIECAAGDRRLAERAESLGAMVRSEDGVSNAVGVLERIHRDHPRSA
jgi:sterol 3beta-glucosyltransferase